MIRNSHRVCSLQNCLFLSIPLLLSSLVCEALISSFLGQSVPNCNVARQYRCTFDASDSFPRRSMTMKVRIGILGLPNVGKSSLFNALAQQSIAQAANFPFCTIDPNIAQVSIPDPYLESLGLFAKSARTVPATIEWVDVAGLAKGAHRGDGLGNRFLGTLRDCQAICHVVRAFEDPNVVHVDGKVDQVKDIEAINLELLFADMAHVERRLGKTNVPPDERRALERIAKGLERGIPARAVELSIDEKFLIKSMGLLTLKPMMYAFNVDEVDYVLGRDEMSEKIQHTLETLDDYESANECLWTLVSAKLESELALLSVERQVDYLASLGVSTSKSLQQYFSYNSLPTMAQQLLGLSLVYTGPGVPPERSKTTRAHLFSRLTAQELAGRLHGDIEKGFLRAEVTSASKLLGVANYAAAKEDGCIRTEGREYQIQESEVVLIRWK